jgi:hypothetical protein
LRRFLQHRIIRHRREPIVLTVKRNHVTSCALVKDCAARRKRMMGERLRREDRGPWLTEVAPAEG